MFSDDEPEFYREHRRRALRQHQCIECPRPIEYGEEHVYVSGKWDGSIGYHRQHLDCHALFCEASEKIGEGRETLCFGRLREGLEYVEDERERRALVERHVVDKPPWAVVDWFCENLR